MLMKLALTSLAIIVIIASGCASIGASGYPGVYCGVKKDIDRWEQSTSIEEDKFVIADLPFSAFLDTLLLPYDLLHE
jgi:uncharacterized protein YceK